MSGGIGGGADEGFDLTAKGQIHAHDGTSQVALSVGTDGQVLKANSAQTNGIAWEDASGGAEFFNISTATTTTPTKQTGLSFLKVDRTNSSGGTLTVNVDGSADSSYVAGSSLASKFINPSSSISIVTADEEYTIGSGSRTATYKYAQNPPYNMKSGLPNGNGTYYWIMEDNDYKFWRFSLSTAYDVSTATVPSTYSVTINRPSTSYTNQKCAKYIDDGNKLIFCGQLNGEPTLHTCNLSTAYDPSTRGAWTTVNWYSTHGWNQYDNIWIGEIDNENGTKLYVGREYSPAVYQQIVYEYDLSTPFDITTATLNQSYNFALTGAGIWNADANIRSNGTKWIMVWGEHATQTLNEYDLTTPYDITTATLKNSWNPVTATTGQSLYGDVNLWYRFDNGTQAYTSNRGQSGLMTMQTPSITYAGNSYVEVS